MLVGAHESPLPDCEICGGLGWFTYAGLPVGHPEFGRAQVCACQQKRLDENLQQLSGLAPSERSLTLSEIDTEAGAGTAAMVTAVQEFIADPRGILTIYGTSGNAKTAALQATVNAMVAQHVEAVYITIFDLIGWVRNAFREDGSINDQDAWKRIKRIEAVRVLALDEFDKVKRRTDWVLDQITDLVDARHRFGLDGVVGTLIAMNDEIEALPTWIASRLKDGRNRLVVNDDPDLRPLMRR